MDITSYHITDDILIMVYFIMVIIIGYDYIIDRKWNDIDDGDDESIYDTHIQSQQHVRFCPCDHDVMSSHMMSCDIMLI